MAAQASSSGAGRSLTGFQYLRKPNNFPSTLQLLSPPWMMMMSPHHLTMIISSSPSPPPPTLKDDKPIFLELTYDYEASDPPWNHFKTTQSGSQEEFILELLTSPSTQELALQMYAKARKEAGFRPCNPTLKAVLMCLLKSRRWRQHLDLILDDVKLMDSATCAWLVSACVRSRKFRVVDVLLQEAFKGGGDVGSPALEAAIKGYNKLHMYSSSVSAYELKMKKSPSSVVLDPAGYPLIMEAYMKLGKSGKVLELFKELESNRKIEHTSNPTRVYEILIEALGRSGEAFIALDYFRDMNLKGIPVNALIYSSLIGSLANAGQVKATEDLVEQGRRNQMLKDPAMFLKLVLMYVKQGLIERTLGVVEAMREANIRVSDCIFCAIINGFAKQRGLTSAVEVHEDLVSQGIEPGQVTLASILNVYFRLGMYAKAELVFEEMEKRGFDRCVVAYSTMIVMYGKTGKPREAMKLVAKMKSKGCEPNVWIYNSLIDLHGRVKNVRHVEKIWKEMKRRKVVPDRVSYTSLINAYSKVREYDKCVDVYREFRLNGGVADRAMAGMMVGVLSKIERIDELVGLLQDMRDQGTKMDERLCRSAMNALRDAGLRVHMSWLEDQSFDPVAMSSTPLIACRSFLWEG